MVFHGLQGLQINPKRRVFISYYHGDQADVDQFIGRWANSEQVFTPEAIGICNDDDFVDSTDPAYVMTQVREKYLKKSTVTIVLIGKCTHSRRYVDWELKTSLRQGNYTPNGVLGILLPACGTSAHMPPRLKDNWSKGDVNCYARYWAAPSSAIQLRGWIEDAFEARTKRAHLITNKADMMKNSSKCNVCGGTH